MPRYACIIALSPQTYTRCFDSSEEIPTMSCRDRERTKTIMKTVCTAKAAMVCQCTNE